VHCKSTPEVEVLERILEHEESARRVCATQREGEPKWPMEARSFLRVVVSLSLARHPKLFGRKWKREGEDGQRRKESVMVGTRTQWERQKRYATLILYTLHRNRRCLGFSCMLAREKKGVSVRASPTEAL
jgi:hypothetical protein